MPQSRGIALPPEVLHYLMTHMPRDLSTQVAILDALDSYALAAQRAITVPLIREWAQSPCNGRRICQCSWRSSTSITRCCRSTVRTPGRTTSYVAAASTAATYTARIEHFAQDYRAGTFDVDAYVRFQMELLAAFPREELDAWHAEFMQRHVTTRDARAGEAAGRRPSAPRRRTRRWSPAPMPTSSPRSRERSASTTCWPSSPSSTRASSPAASSARTRTRTARCARSRNGWPRAAIRWPTPSRLFYSDSINDLPLLERVTHPVVTNGDARLQAIARERGWPTLQLFEAADA